MAQAERQDQTVRRLQFILDPQPPALAGRTTRSRGVGSHASEERIAATAGVDDAKQQRAARQPACVLLAIHGEADAQLVRRPEVPAAEGRDIHSQRVPLVDVVERAIEAATLAVLDPVAAVRGGPCIRRLGAAVRCGGYGGPGGDLRTLRRKPRFDQDHRAERNGPGQYAVRRIERLAQRGIGSTPRAEAHAVGVAATLAQVQGQLVARTDLPGQPVVVRDRFEPRDRHAPGRVDRVRVVGEAVGRAVPQPIADDRPTQADVDVVGAVTRRVAVEAMRAVEQLDLPLMIVAALFLNDSRESALRASILDTGARGDDLHLFDGVRVDLAHLLAGQRIDVRDAADDRLEVAAARAVNVRVAVAVRVLDSRSEGDHVLIEAARHRQIRDELAGEANRRRVRAQVDDGRARGNGDTLPETRRMGRRAPRRHGRSGGRFDGRKRFRRQLLHDRLAKPVRVDRRRLVDGDERGEGTHQAMFQRQCRDAVAHLLDRKLGLAREQFLDAVSCPDRGQRGVRRFVLGKAHLERRFPGTAAEIASHLQRTAPRAEVAADEVEVLAVEQVARLSRREVADG